MESDTLINAKKKLKEGDYAHAIMLLEDLALKREAEAFYLLGQCYAFSLGVPNYAFIANECYTMAKKLGWQYFDKTCEQTTIYLIIDVSDDMEFLRNDLEKLITDTIERLKELDNKELWMKFKIRAMAFSDIVRWYKNFESIEINKFDFKMPKSGSKFNLENMLSEFKIKILSLQNDKNECNKSHLFLFFTNKDVKTNLENAIKTEELERLFLFSGRIAFALHDINNLNFQYKEVKNEICFGKITIDNSWMNMTIERMLYEFCMPESYIEWPVSSISDSMEQIDHEISMLINYMRE